MNRKTEICEKAAKMYKCICDGIFTLGLKTNFGGSKCSGFPLIYDIMNFVKKFEPKYRLACQGVITKDAKDTGQGEEEPNEEGQGHQECQGQSRFQDKDTLVCFYRKKS